MTQTLIIEDRDLAVAPDSLRKRILLAEDNDSMRHLLARALAAAGFEVIEARNGFELMHWVDVLSEWSLGNPVVDLIVTDLRMPMFSGLDCMEQLRHAGSRVPTILITAFGDWQVHEQALACGARAVFDKPLDIARLRETIGQILDA